MKRRACRSRKAIHSSSFPTASPMPCCSTRWNSRKRTTSRCWRSAFATKADRTGIVDRGEPFMTNPKLAVALILALLIIPEARAQVLVDVAKITCEQFVLWKVTDPEHIAIWLSGYSSGKRGDTVIDTQKLKENTDEVTNYCRANLNLTVMQAVETVLGTGR